MNGFLQPLPSPDGSLRTLFARRTQSTPGGNTLADKALKTFTYIGEGFSDPDVIQFFDARAIRSIPDYCAEFLDNMHHSVPENFYTSIAGENALVTALSLKAMEQGLYYNGPENIVVTAGAVNGFHALCHSLCDEGDVILALSPSYILFSGAVKAFGGEMMLVPSVRNGNAFCIDPATLENKIQDIEKSGRNVKAVLVINPTNIDSRCWTRDEIDRLAPILHKHDLMIIEDRVYDGLQYAPPSNPAFFANHPDLANRTVTLDSVSKRFGATQWRIGWICGPETLVDHARSAVMQSVWSPNSKYQIATALMIMAGLNERNIPQTALGHLARQHKPEQEKYENDVREDYAFRRDLCFMLIHGQTAYSRLATPDMKSVLDLQKKFADLIENAPDLHEGVNGFSTPVIPQAGMFLLIQASETLLNKLSGYQDRDLILARLLYKEAGVVCLPPSELTLPENENLFRIEFGIDLENIIEGLSRINKMTTYLLESSPEVIEHLIKRHVPFTQTSDRNFPAQNSLVHSPA